MYYSALTGFLLLFVDDDATGFFPRSLANALNHYLFNWLHTERTTREAHNTDRAMLC